MNLKTFRAKTTAEALAQVKRELGPNAVILHTRTVSGSALLGRGRRGIVEVTATNDVTSVAAARTTRPPRSTTHDAEPPHRPNCVPEPDRRVEPAGADVTGLAGQIARLEATVSKLVAAAKPERCDTLPVTLRDIYQELIEAEVAEELAAQLVRRMRAERSQLQLSDTHQVRRRLAEYIASMLPTADPVMIEPGAGPVVLAIVGPTGVGKTTTAAKLAAQYVLRRGRSVGMITADTYRIAAVEQLQTYARVLDVPLAVVSTPEEMSGALEAMNDRDLVLVDTAGISPNDAEKLGELEALLQRAQPDEVHLALSSASSTPACQAAIGRFNRLGVNRLIFTKLDEAVGFGVVLNCLNRATARLSYVTTGQVVPDDIAPGREAGLVDRILRAHRVTPA